MAALLARFNKVGETTGLRPRVLCWRAAECGWGRARVKTPMTMSVEIQRRLNTVIQKHRETVGDIIVVVNTDVLNRFKSEDAKLLGELERSHSGRLIFRSDPTLNRERFHIVDAATEKTIDQG